MGEIKEISNNKCFEGWQKVFSHESSELNCKMNFGVFLPEKAKKGPVPVIYWLSGLTCTEANFIQKSGFQKYAAEYGIIVVNPDTSPRGEGIPDDEAYDFGMGAGFYVDAVKDPWKNNFRMYSYVTKELQELINKNFPVVKDQQSIMGHSMGGHGALICALKNPGMFKSVSAFAPISNPIECEWGKKAFGGYLGTDLDLWKDYDACHLVKNYSGPRLEILIDQGSEDNFLKQKQLLPESLVTAGENIPDVQINLRLQDGYDHSYFFISTFIQEHMKHHSKYLKN